MTRHTLFLAIDVTPPLSPGTSSTPEDLSFALSWPRNRIERPFYLRTALQRTLSSTKSVYSDKRCAAAIEHGVGVWDPTTSGLRLSTPPYLSVS